MWTPLYKYYIDDIIIVGDRYHVKCEPQLYKYYIDDIIIFGDRYHF
jgi:hypothetical protein